MKTFVGLPWSAWAIIVGGLLFLGAAWWAMRILRRKNPPSTEVTTIIHSKQ